MKNFSFAAWPYLLYLLFSGYTTHASPSHYTPFSPSLKSGKTTNANPGTFLPAHRVTTPGHLLHEDSAKMNFCLSDSELNSFRNQGISRSVSNPGLDLFDTFWEGRVLRNSPVDCFNEGARRRVGLKYDAPSKIGDFAQQQTTITGTVTYNGIPMQGVTISVKGKNTTTVSATDGTYNIAATTGDILQFSYIGFKTIEVTVGNDNVINTTMTDDVSALQEVTVNAGYYKVKDKERTGSIAKITAKDIENQPVSNILATMQGRMAGVNITQTTGVPGGGFDIQIRGLNSVRADGNDPLYVIDGVPYSSESISGGQTATVLPSRPSPLNSIAPDQVESIEVLKDADATAIYGSRGANGVVLITTKKGSAGKTRFTANVSTGVGTVANFIDLLSTEQYLQMRRDAFTQDGLTEYGAQDYDVNGTWDQSRYTNWQKELLGKTAQYSNFQASVSGGSAQTQFLMSAGLNKQTTVFPGDFNYKKANVQVNANHESGDKRFKSVFSASYVFQDNLQPRTDPTFTALSLAPNAPALYDDQGNLNWEGSTWNNPLADFIPEYTAKAYDLNVNSILSYQLAKGLELRSSFGYTTTTNDEVTLLPSTRYDPAGGLGPEVSTIIVGKHARKSWIVEPQLNWSGRFGKAKLEFLVGSSFQSLRSEQLVQLGQGFSSNSLINNLASATTVTTNVSEEQQYKYMAVYARANIIWDEKYIVNLTGRRDGSSRFGPGKQFANFGALGAAWIFSKEKVLADNKLLSFGKLRASYGITGNDQIGNYQYLDTYALGNVNYNGVIGLQPVRLFNPDFRWETNRKLEAALETGFFNDRIFATVAWYRNVSSDQLTGMPLPGTTGFTSMIVNLDAVIENTGMEYTLRTENIRRKDFSWTTSLNLSVAKNRLKEFPDLESSTYKNLYAIGESLNIRKVYHYTGVDPETGLYTFEDKNGDGQITAADDKQYVQDLIPDFFGGLQNEVRYKRWNLSFLFQFVKQRNYNENALFSVPGLMTQQPVSAMEYWQAPGDTVTHQMLTTGVNGDVITAFERYIASDALVGDASFVRLKNLSLSYDLPEGLLKNTQCRLFFEGQNLLTFTKYKGLDPEFKSTGYLPALRVLSAGVQFTF